MLSMESNGPNNVNELLVSLTQNFKVTLSALSKITNLNVELLEKIMNNKNDLVDSGLSVKELHKLVSTASMLEEVVPGIDDDIRLQTIIENLTQEFEIGFETISIYTQISVEDLQNFMQEPNSIPYEKKYRLAVKSLFLHYLLK